MTDLLAALSEYGTVLDVRPGKGPAIIVHIQDVHGRLEAQKNISSLILKLLEIDPDAVIGLEGGAGRVPIEKFLVPSNEANRKTGSFLLENGLLTGGEYAGFAAITAPRMYGLEVPQLYLQNVAAVRAALAEQPARLKEIEDGRRSIAARKPKVYSPALLAMDAEWSAYHAGDRHIADYISYLGKILAPAKHPQVALFLDTWKLENTLDYARAEKEREQILAGAPHSKTPEFASYLRYIQQAQSLHTETLLAELSRYEKEVWKILCKTNMQRDLQKEAAGLVLKEKLVRLTLTPAEWTEYSSSPHVVSGDLYQESPWRENNRGSRLKISGATKSFEAFYRFAEQRNHALSENFRAHQGKKISVLVAGGFHTDGLRNLLADGKATFITVCPKLKDVKHMADNDYLEVFTREKTPLEKLFESPRISLTNTLGTCPIPAGNGLDPEKVKRISEIDEATLIALQDQITQRLDTSIALAKASAERDTNRLWGDGGTPGDESAMGRNAAREIESFALQFLDILRDARERWGKNNVDPDRLGTILDIFLTGAAATYPGLIQVIRESKAEQQSLGELLTFFDTGGVTFHTLRKIGYLKGLAPGGKEIFQQTVTAIIHHIERPFFAWLGSFGKEVRHVPVPGLNDHEVSILEAGIILDQYLILLAQKSAVVRSIWDGFLARGATIPEEAYFLALERYLMAKTPPTKPPLKFEDMLAAVNELLRQPGVKAPKGAKGKNAPEVIAQKLMKAFAKGDFSKAVVSNAFTSAGATLPAGKAETFSTSLKKRFSSWLLIGVALSTIGLMGAGPVAGSPGFPVSSVIVTIALLVGVVIISAQMVGMNSRFTGDYVPTDLVDPELPLPDESTTDYEWQKMVIAWAKNAGMSHRKAWAAFVKARFDLDQESLRQFLVSIHPYAQLPAKVYSRKYLRFREHVGAYFVLQSLRRRGIYSPVVINFDPHTDVYTLEDVDNEVTTANWAKWLFKDGLAREYLNVVPDDNGGFDIFRFTDAAIRSDEYLYALRWENFRRLIQGKEVVLTIDADFWSLDGKRGYHYDTPKKIRQRLEQSPVFEVLKQEKAEIVSVVFADSLHYLSKGFKNEKARERWLKKLWAILIEKCEATFNDQKKIPGLLLAGIALSTIGLMGAGPVNGQSFLAGSVISLVLFVMGVIFVIGHALGVSPINADGVPSPTRADLERDLKFNIGFFSMRLNALRNEFPGLNIPVVRPKQPYKVEPLEGENIIRIAISPNDPGLLDISVDFSKVKTWEQLNVAWVMEQMRWSKTNIDPLLPVPEAEPTPSLPVARAPVAPVKKTKPAKSPKKPKLTDAMRMAGVTMNEIEIDGEIYTVYGIGIAGMKLESFSKLFGQMGTATILDTRREPGSANFPWSNQLKLKKRYPSRYKYLIKGDLKRLGSMIRSVTNRTVCLLNVPSNPDHYDRKNPLQYLLDNYPVKKTPPPPPTAIGNVSRLLLIGTAFTTLGLMAAEPAGGAQFLVSKIISAALGLMGIVFILIHFGQRMTGGIPFFLDFPNEQDAWANLFRHLLDEGVSGEAMREFRDIVDRRAASRGEDSVLKEARRFLSDASPQVRKLVAGIMKDRPVTKWLDLLANTEIFRDLDRLAGDLMHFDGKGHPWYMVPEKIVVQNRWGENVSIEIVLPRAFHQQYADVGKQIYAFVEHAGINFSSKEIHHVSLTNLSGLRYRPDEINPYSIPPKKISDNAELAKALDDVPFLMFKRGRNHAPFLYVPLAFLVSQKSRSFLRQAYQEYFSSIDVTKIFFERFEARPPGTKITLQSLSETVEGQLEHLIEEASNMAAYAKFLKYKEPYLRLQADRIECYTAEPIELLGKSEFDATRREWRQDWEPEITLKDRVEWNASGQRGERMLVLDIPRALRPGRPLNKRRDLVINFAQEAARRLLHPDDAPDVPYVVTGTFRTSSADEPTFSGDPFLPRKKNDAPVWCLVLSLGGKEALRIPLPFLTDKDLTPLVLEMLDLNASPVYLERFDEVGRVKRVLGEAIAHKKYFDPNNEYRTSVSDQIRKSGKRLQIGKRIANAAGFAFLTIALMGAGPAGGTAGFPILAMVSGLFLVVGLLIMGVGMVGNSVGDSGPPLPKQDRVPVWVLEAFNVPANEFRSYVASQSPLRLAEQIKRFLLANPKALAKAGEIVQQIKDVTPLENVPALAGVNPPKAFERLVLEAMLDPLLAKKYMGLVGRRSSIKTTLGIAVQFMAGPLAPFKSMIVPDQEELGHWEQYVERLAKDPISLKILEFEAHGYPLEYSLGYEGFDLTYAISHSLDRIQDLILHGVGQNVMRMLMEKHRIPITAIPMSEVRARLHDVMTAVTKFKISDPFLNLKHRLMIADPLAYLPGSYFKSSENLARSVQRGYEVAPNVMDQTLRELYRTQLRPGIKISVDGVRMKDYLDSLGMDSTFTLPVELTRGESALIDLVNQLNPSIRKRVQSIPEVGRFMRLWNEHGKEILDAARKTRIETLASYIDALQKILNSHLNAQSFDGWSGGPEEFWKEEDFLRNRINFLKDRTNELLYARLPAVEKDLLREGFDFNETKDDMDRRPESKQPPVQDPIKAKIEDLLSVPLPKNDWDKQREAHEATEKAA